jgi:universal stress protein E
MDGRDLQSGVGDMFELKRILVGVDLLESRQGNLSPPVAEAVKQALWLAEKMSGEVTFCTVFNLREEEELYTPLGEHERLVSQAAAAAQEELNRLVEQAGQRGMRATGRLADGQGWIELTREAIEGKYDLVVVGTRNFGAVRRALFGSTAMKLLHNCPCPVWVAKPEPHPMPQNLLVASDFSGISDDALRLAVRIASASGAELHVIHVVRYPYARLRDAGLLAEVRREELHRRDDRAAGETRLREQVARILGESAPVTVAVHAALDTYISDDAIAGYIDDHQIDLLVIGTSARRGLAGAFLGNTAERLLTMVNCSLLAVKPSDFVCPVRLESYHYGEPKAYL